MIVTYGGKDATDVFACFHAATSWSQLRQFHVGDLVSTCVNTAVLAGLWPAPDAIYSSLLMC